MIIDFNRYNGGGGSGSGVTPEQVEQQINSALTPYWDSAETQDAIDAALSGFTPAGNSNILAAITSLAEYEAISGSVNVGDLIQVVSVDINGDGEDENGLFERTNAPDVSDMWQRKDNEDSLVYSGKYYPWMDDNGILPIEISENAFLIAPDGLAEDGAYNGIGFDGDGVPVITHIVPQYEEGEITGMTREDKDILTDLPNFATINGSAITDGGNIVISIPDVSNYVTSAQTEDAISAATSGKADAANVSANTDNFQFPRWNTQGIITGKTGDAYGAAVTVNNETLYPYAQDSMSLTFYAPQSAGTAGEILVSTGNGAPVWSAVTFPDVSNYVTSAQVETQIVEKNYITSAATANMVTSTSVSTIWKGTQAQYDAIVDKDPNTFYIIL